MDSDDRLLEPDAGPTTVKTEPPGAPSLSGGAASRFAYSDSFEAEPRRISPALPAIGGLREKSAAWFPGISPAGGDDRPNGSAAGPWWRAKSVAHAAQFVLLGLGAWIGFILVLILLYRFVNPPVSALMVLKWVGGTSIEQTWVPIEEISPNLVRAVVAAEDGRFCRHSGVDLVEIERAFERATDGVPRGASTISMQVTKNLFLWPAKSYVRKAIEVPLTFVIELIWPKWRIMEVYLNVAEWGPGVFGAEAAARYHFNRSASRLTERQAALLAVALPNPVARDAGEPGRGTSRLASAIQVRMRVAGRAAACVIARN